MSEDAALERVEKLYDEALAAYEDKRVFEAVRYAEEGLRLGTPLAGLHLLRAMCLLAIGRLDEAWEETKLELAGPSPHGGTAKVQEEIRKAMDARADLEERPRTWGWALTNELYSTIQSAANCYEYRGVPLVKDPFTFALFPMLLWRLRPRTIFEIGSFQGGTALWMADMLNNFGIPGHVYSVDVVRATAVSHPRITFLQGSGRALDGLFRADLFELPSARPFLVIDDADHSYETTLAVMQFFNPRLTTGDYIVISDTLTHPGTRRAIDEFRLQHWADYDLDPSYCDYFGYNLTWCANGFFRRR
jgi:cephalosporin hydroxylase